MNSGTISSSGTVTGTSLIGTVATAAQGQITSLGTLTSLNSGTISSSGTVTGTNHIGAGTGLTGTAASLSIGGSAASATTAGTVTTAAQPNITSVGSSLTTSGALTVNSSNGVTAIINGGTNGGGNIGASGQTFNFVYATTFSGISTTAKYADLAEKYVADAAYAPGTVLVFGGNQEVTVNAVDSDTKVAGVVSTNPGFVMNEGLEAEHVAAVALTGRVPTLVVGPVRKGDLMVSAGLGRARAEADPRVGTVIGKALEDFNGAEGTIEVVVGRF